MSFLQEMISLTKGVTSVDTTAAVQSVSAPDEQDAGPLVLSALCVSSFLATLNFFAATPFYPEMAEDLNTTVPLLGQVTTAMILISTVLGLAIGPLADRYGYRWPLVIGVLAIAINLTGIGLAPSYPVLLLLSLFGGLGDALVFGLPLAIAGLRYSGEAQRRAISWTLGSLSSAAIIGTPVLTAIGSATSWRAALVCAGALSAMAAVFVLLALPADGRHPQRALRVRELLSAYRPLLGHGPVLRQYAATALRAITWIGMLTYLGAFLSDEVGLSTSAVGLVFMVGGSGFALGNFLGGRLLGDAVHIRVALLCCRDRGAGGIAALVNRGPCRRAGAFRRGVLWGSRGAGDDDHSGGGKPGRARYNHDAQWLDAQPGHGHWSRARRRITQHWRLQRHGAWIAGLRAPCGGDHRGRTDGWPGINRSITGGVTAPVTRLRVPGAPARDWADVRPARGQL